MLTIIQSFSKLNTENLIGTLNLETSRILTMGFSTVLPGKSYILIYHSWAHCFVFFQISNFFRYFTFFIIQVFLARDSCRLHEVKAGPRFLRSKIYNEKGVYNEFSKKSGEKKYLSIQCKGFHICFSIKIKTKEIKNSHRQKQSNEIITYRTFT